MLAGKRIVVTGATGGIGSAIARRCAKEGAVVGVHTVSKEEDARLLAHELGGHPLVFDVRDATSVTAELNRFATLAGGIDGLVNNAGVHRAELLVQADDANIREQLDVNLLGPILCTRAVLAHMLRARCGVIVNIGSMTAHHPVRAGAVYASTKGALESLSMAVAREYGKKGIRCTCVHPGPIDTPMLGAIRALADDEVHSQTALKRLGTPAEVAAFVAFLLSDDARFITGSAHAVDGGAP
jgi:NAD(P)-dependent dehydrogenase (short-subunit alcohol dehydrogenase family)